MALRSSQTAPGRQRLRPAYRWLAVGAFALAVLLLAPGAGTTTGLQRGATSPSPGTAHATASRLSPESRGSFPPASPRTLYDVYFNETGLSSGSTWSVTANASPSSSATPSIEVQLASGTYVYSVGAISGYTATPSGGNLTITNKTVIVVITFSLAPISASLSGPSGLALGSLLQLQTHTTNGVYPLSFAYHALPPGCASANSEFLNCTPSSTGTYGIGVTVTDHAGRDANATLAVMVNATAPVGLNVTASASPSGGAAPLATHLSATATGGTGPYSYTWDLGDGSASTGQNVSHTYALPGAYVATVFAQDAEGVTAVASVAVAVSAGSHLSVSLVASPANGTAPLSVNLVSAVGGGVAPYTYAWNFGDGNVSHVTNGTAPSSEVHSYSVPGAYLATVTVTDSAGTAAQAQAPVQVFSDAASAIHVASVANRTTSAPGEPVAFHVAASGGSGPYYYAWEFGDGAHAAVANPSHAYATPGSYVATVIVTDQKNNGYASFLTVSVGSSGSALSVNAVATPGATTATSEDVAFSAFAPEATGTLAYSWNFGDGSPLSHAASPSHVYNTSGTYGASVTIVSGSGLTGAATVTVPVTLSRLLLLAWTGPANGTAPLTVNFTSACAGGSPPYTYNWNWGNGGTSNQLVDQQTYNASGNYTVHLTATDSAGRTQSLAFVVSVKGSPTKTSGPPSSGIPTIFLVGIAGAVAACGVAASVMFGVHRRKPPASARADAPPIPEGSKVTARSEIPPPPPDD